MAGSTPTSHISCGSERCTVQSAVHPSVHVPPLLHVGAPPSVHPVSGSLLPSSACWACGLAPAGQMQLCSLLCVWSERKPTPPRCDLPAFCTLPAHPTTCHSIPTTCHHFLVSSSRRSPSPPDSPRCFVPGPPCLTTQCTPPQRSFCPPARPRWAVSRAQSIHCQPALHSSATCPVQPPSPPTLWSLSTIGVWPWSSRLKTWFGRRTGLLARPAKNTEQSITSDRLSGTQFASICYLWIQGSGNQWGHDGSSRDLCEEQRQRCEAKLYLPHLWRNRSGSRPPCSPLSRG